LLYFILTFLTPIKEQFNSSPETHTGVIFADLKGGKNVVLQCHRYTLNCAYCISALT